MSSIRKNDKNNYLQSMLDQINDYIEKLNILSDNSRLE